MIACEVIDGNTVGVLALFALLAFVVWWGFPREGG